MKKCFFVLALMVLVLSACATPATPAPIPTETSTPIPSITPIPPTATVEPSPTATPDPFLFRDDFDGVLDKDWQWIREKDKYWNLTKNAGWLEIMARSGNIGDSTISNMLVRPAPEGNFELETQLKFKPAGNYQIAGLLIYESAENHIVFGRAFCSAPACVGDGYYFDFISDGNFTPENFATKAPETDTLYLRLLRQGDIYTAYGSEDRVEWKVIGTHNSSLKPLFIGLVAGQAYQTTPKAAQFDYLNINALP